MEMPSKERHGKKEKPYLTNQTKPEDMSTATIPITWNHFVCEALYITNTPPTIGSRALAMIHTAMYNAFTVYVESKEQPTHAELFELKACMPDGDKTPRNQQEAYCYATYKVLTDDRIYAAPLPTDFRVAVLDYMKNTLGYDPNNKQEDPDKPAGVGLLAARLVLDERLNDKSNQEHQFADNSNYQAVNEPWAALPKDLGHWQAQIRNGKPQAFLTPHWGKVKPFALKSGKMFRPVPPIKKEDAWKFKNQGDKVTDAGCALTDKQKIIAEFWAGMHEDQFEQYLQGEGNYKHWIAPPAQVCRIACTVLKAECADVRVAIAYFFAVSNALMDAGIAAWDCKRFYDYVRPITLIQRLRDYEKFQAWGGPGRGVIEIEGEGFQPYIPTPPFAEYVSGHSTFSAAMAEISKCFFKSGGKYEECVVIPMGGSKIEGDCEPALPSCDIELSWNSIQETADEAGISRIYGGIHFKDGDLNGRKLGREVARCVWAKVDKHLFGEVEYKDLQLA